MIDQFVWKTTDKLKRFSRLVNLDALQNYNDFAELYASVFEHQAANIATIFKKQYGKEKISSIVKILSLKNQLQDDIKRDEKAYFSPVGPERRALSIKLTVAAKLNKSFVANKRL